MFCGRRRHFVSAANMGLLFEMNQFIHVMFLNTVQSLNDDTTLLLRLSNLLDCLFIFCVIIRKFQEVATVINYNI